MDTNLRTERASSSAVIAKQTQAICALLASKTVEEAAEKVGVNPRTLHRWLSRDSDFLARLRTAENRLMDETVKMLAAESSKVLGVISKIALDEDSPASVRLQAAATGLKLLVKLRGAQEVEARLTVLEERIVQYV